MVENSKNSIAFLFGAGISQNSLISTDNLTRKILNADNIIRLSGQYFEHEKPESFRDIDVRDYVPRIKELFNIVRDTFTDHYLYKDKGMNYEDLYYIINTIYENENGEYENPIVSKYSDSFKAEYSKLLVSKYAALGDLRLIDLAREALHYIHDLIVSALSKPDAPTDHLRFLSEVIDDRSLSKVYIFTLNNDLLIENYFKDKIEYSDGFNSDGFGHRVWSPMNFDKRISLLKLHGSINWQRMVGRDYYDYKIVIYERPQRDSERPLIIIGRFNKLQAYTRSINFELQCLFADQLNKSSILIISGYSFGDQGINSRIIDWALGSTKRRIFLIHKDPDELLLNARPAIRSIFPFLDKQNNLILIKDFITPDTNWSEIRKIINT